ncbi:MAG: hypothetical protein JNL83_23645, partial [Myxococcales bacterium]|nr:hypothetical protein [Myxococcales bacterium]
RAAWGAWLGKTFATALTTRALLSPRSATEYARRDALFAVVPGPALGKDVVARARKVLERELKRSDPEPQLLELALRLAAHTGGAALWKQMQRVIADGDEDVTAALLAGAPALGAAFAKDIADAIEATKLPSDLRAAAYGALLSHPETRAAAWSLLTPKLAAIVRALKPADARSLVAFLGQTCTQAASDGLRDVSDDAVAPARAALDRCLARKATAGPLRLPAN